jgi:hypothetical protein
MSSPTLVRNLPFTRDQRSCSVFVIAENFSLRGIGCCEIAVLCWMPHGVTSIGKRLLQGIDRPCGKNAASTIHPLKRKIASRGQRVLSGLSGAGACNWAEKELE